MSTDDQRRDEDQAATPETDAATDVDEQATEAQTQDEAAADGGEADEQQEERLPLDVQKEETGPCKVRLQVTVPREAIDARLDEALDEMIGSAQVPGFRPGHAPRKLVQKRFRREMADQVRGNLVAGSLEQAIDEQELIPVSMPDVDMESVEMPDDGPLTYKVELEVRPTFDLPEYKGLKVRRPIVDVTDEDVDKALDAMRQRQGRLVAKDGDTCEADDFVVANCSFRHGEEEVATVEEVTLPAAEQAFTRYATLQKVGEALAGAQVGDERVCEAELNQTFEREELRGQMVQCTIKVVELKTMDVPELTDEFAKEHLGVDTVDEARQRTREAMEASGQRRQSEFCREEVSRLLVDAAEWGLPEDLVAKQSDNVMSRTRVDMLMQGVPAEMLDSRVEEMQAASYDRAERQLKQFFLLDKIADAEEVEVEEADVDEQIAAMAGNYGESPRRLRARMEQEDRLDMIRIQVRETKTMDKILEYAEFEDVTPEQLAEESRAAASEDASAAEEAPEPASDAAETPDADAGAEPKES